MPIAFDCTCGKTLRVPDESAGRRAKCPACGAVVQIPQPEPEFEIVEEPPPPPPRPGAARHGLAPAPKPVENDDSDDGGTYGLADGGDDDYGGGSARDDTEVPKGKPRLPNFRKGRDKHS